MGPSERGVSNGGSKGEVPAEDAPGGTPTGWTGGRPQKAEAQIGQKWSVERADVANGQGKTGPGAPRELERVQPRGGQLRLDQAPSKKRPEPTPMIAHIEDFGNNQKCPRNGGDKVSEKKFHLKIPTRRNPTQERPVEGEESSDCEVGKKAFSTSGALRIHQMIHDEQRRPTGDVEKWEETVQINKNRGKHKRKDRRTFSERGKGKGTDCPKCNKRCSDQYALKST